MAKVVVERGANSRKFIIKGEEKTPTNLESGLERTFGTRMI